MSFFFPTKMKVRSAEGCGDMFRGRALACHPQELWVPFLAPLREGGDVVWHFPVILVYMWENRISSRPAYRLHRLFQRRNED